MKSRAKNSMDSLLKSLKLKRGFVQESSGYAFPMVGDNLFQPTDFKATFEDVSQFLALF